MDKYKVFADKLYEIEILKVQYNLKSFEILMLQLFAIIELSETDYEIYKKELTEKRNNDYNL